MVDDFARMGPYSEYSARMTLEEYESEKAKQEKRIAATDGASLSLEAVSLGKYHVASRRFPVPGDYLGLFKSMLQLSGIDEKVAFDAK